MPDTGSSPLTRGKHRRRRPHSAARGLIPAHAGKTPAPRSGCGMAWAHPRSRGENCWFRLTSSPRAGSSPLTRGKPRLHAPPLPQLRLIPAHAGKTPHQRSTRKPRRAHPRSRGENGQDHLRPDQGVGSSPLTRGKRSRQAQRLLPVRLIPAHAGKTPSPSSSAAGITAHPRSRGENLPIAPVTTRIAGSSPLTRGKL